MGKYKALSTQQDFIIGEAGGVVEEPQFLIITEKDVGRKVVNGHGEIGTILRFDTGDDYPVKTTIWKYTTTGKFGTFTDAQHPLNLVGFVEEPQLVITEKDIGRKVIDGYGDEETIVGFDTDDDYPVETDAGNYSTDGKHDIDSTHNPRMNLVGFVDEAKEERVVVTKINYDEDAYQIDDTFVDSMVEEYEEANEYLQSRLDWLLAEITKVEKLKADNKLAIDTLNELISRAIGVS